MPTSSGNGGQMSPEFPPAENDRRGRRFSGFDITGLAVLAVLITVADVVFMARVKDVGSKHSGPVLLAWLLVVGVACLAGGLFQAGRARPWWEIVVIGAFSGALAGFVILVIADPTAGSKDCPGSGPCDTSFGAGAILIGVLLTPVFTGFAAAGRGLGNLVFRRIH